MCDHQKYKYTYRHVYNIMYMMLRKFIRPVGVYKVSPYNFERSSDVRIRFMRRIKWCFHAYLRVCFVCKISTRDEHKYTLSTFLKCNFYFTIIFIHITLERACVGIAMMRFRRKLYSSACVLQNAWKMLKILQLHKHFWHGYIYDNTHRNFVYT